MKPMPYREGSWFALPLREGCYAAGLLARAAPGGHIILAYLFGPRRNSFPAMAELAQLQARDALLHLRTGDLGLLNGSWPILGQAQLWDRGAWPMPPFIRRTALLRRAWRATYADLDPSKLEREESIPYDTAGLESDSLYGYGAAELLMTKLLLHGRGQGRA